MDKDNYTVIIICSSILSSSGSAFMIYSFFNQVDKQNIAQKLIFFLSFGDLFYSLDQMIYIFPGDNPINWQCNLQAFIKQATCLSTFGSSFFISFCIYQSVMKKKEINYSFQNYIRVFCFAIPIISAIIPLIFNDYGSNSYACSFKTKEVFSFSFFFFYIPLWTTSILNIYFSYQVFKYFKQIYRQSQDMTLSKAAKNEELQLKLSSQIIVLVMFYPLICVFCWTPYTIYSICAYFKKDLEFLAGWRFIIASLQGFLNALVQWRSKIITDKFRRKTMDLLNFDDRQSRSSSITSNEEDFQSEIIEDKNELKKSDSYLMTYNITNQL